MSTVGTDTMTTIPEETDDDFAWSLHVVHHDTHAITPVRCTLGRSEHATLRRGGGDFGAGLPTDPRISRQHACFSVDSSGALHVADEGSRNGVHLRGERVQYATLQPGEVLRVGGFLVVAQVTPLRFDASDAAELPGVGALSGRLARAIRERARREVGGSFVLVGEDGVSGHAVAAAYARLLGTETVSLDAVGAQGVVWVPRAFRSPVERVERALALGRNVIFDATGAPRSWVPHATLASLPTEPMAPLRARREDIPALIVARWRSTGVPWRPLSCAQMTALITAPWPGNDAQLERASDALGLGDDDRVFGELHAIEHVVERDDDGHAVIASDGSGFRTPEGEEVDLRPRPVLARVLRALCATRHPCTVNEITEAAWPGVQLVGESGAARVYSAVATLRRLGLRDALVREDDGYRLDPKRARVE